MNLVYRELRRNYNVKILYSVFTSQQVGLFNRNLWLRKSVDFILKSL